MFFNYILNNTFSTIKILQAVAIADYIGVKSNHLSFKQGDTINLREQKDLWWSGEINGRVIKIIF